MKSLAIEGTARELGGKKLAKKVRREGLVPCVMYGGKEPLHFSATTASLRPLIYTADFHTVNISLGGQNYNAILKSLQTHPVTDAVMHVDFQELIEDRPVFAEIPIRLVGLASGVKAGGKLITKLRKLKIKAFPKNLVSEVKVDVTKLEVGKSVRVQDVQIEGVQFMNAGPIPIASVEITRALRSAAAAAAKEDK